MTDRAGMLNGLRRYESYAPADDVTIEVTRAIFIESTGDVAVIGEHVGETAVTIPGLQGGIWHPMRVKEIRATGTDAAAVIIGR